MIIFIGLFFLFLILTFTVSFDFNILIPIPILILTIANYVFRYGQIEDFENLKLSIKKKEIYKNVVDGQLVEFKKYLGDYYPDIEKKLFDSIKPNNLEMYFVKYPEIKSDKTITDLVHLINSKTESLYKCEIKIEEIKTKLNIRYKDSKAWCLPGLIKEYKGE